MVRPTDLTGASRELGPSDIVDAQDTALRLRSERRQNGEPPSAPGGFRCDATRVVAILSVVATAPFVVNNLLQERFAVGLVGAVVVATLLANARRVRPESSSDPWAASAVTVAIIAFIAVAVVEQGEIGVFWAYPAGAAINFMIAGRRAVVGNALLTSVAAWGAVRTLDTEVAVRAIAALCCVSALTALAVRAIDRQERLLRHWATTDPLTGTLTRSTLDDVLDAVADTRGPAALVAIDVDHFKRINDEYGHDVGDDVLAAVGAMLRQNFGADGHVFRIGGEEFLAVLPDHPIDLAVGAADRVRRSVETAITAADRPVTISAGVAALDDGESVRDWRCRADAELYAAKAAGRNMVLPSPSTSRQVPQRPQL